MLHVSIMGEGIKVPCPIGEGGGGWGTLPCDLSNDLDTLLPVNRPTPVKTLPSPNFVGDDVGGSKNCSESFETHFGLNIFKSDKISFPGPPLRPFQKIFGGDERNQYLNKTVSQ